jgi:hypothetical protein
LVLVCLDFPCVVMLSSPNACLFIARVSVTLYSKTCTKFDAVLLLDPLWNRIRPDTWLQIDGCKKSARPPSCLKFCTLTPKMLILSSTFTSPYNCFTDVNASLGNYGYPLVGVIKKYMNLKSIPYHDVSQCTLTAIKNG